MKHLHLFKINLLSAPPAEEPAVAEVTEKMDDLKVEDDKPAAESENKESSEEKTDTEKTTEE